MGTKSNLIANWLSRGGIFITVLVEGYKNDDVPKIELHRAGAPLLWQTAQLTNVLALVSDDQTAAFPGQRLGFADIEALCTLLTSLRPNG